MVRFSRARDVRGGRYLNTESVRVTSPRRTMSVRSAEVKSFVTDPISNTVSPLRARGTSRLARPCDTILRPPALTIPTTMPTLRRSASTLASIRLRI
jgi:hypothetical protein